jgi:hypothetical protein
VVVDDELVVVGRIVVVVVGRKVVEVVDVDVDVVDSSVVVVEPVDTSSVTFDPFSACEPGGGSVEMTLPESTVSDGWLERAVVKP